MLNQTTQSCQKCALAFNELIKQFKFERLQEAKPEAKKGVYIIRIIKKGKPIKSITPSLASILQIINWALVSKYVLSRLSRLDRIESCEVIYIGAAAPRSGSNGTLASRYEDLANRHTAQFPLWLLLYLGWELEYGWFVNDSPKETEKRLKSLYKQYHDGKLPALVEK